MLAFLTDFARLDVMKLVFSLFTLCRNDKRFFIKTQRRREVAFLLSNLERYTAHLEKYPHSLLVRCLGEKTLTLVVRSLRSLLR